MEAEDRLEMKRKLNAQMEMDKKEQAEQVELGFYFWYRCISCRFDCIDWSVLGIKRLGS